MFCSTLLPLAFSSPPVTVSLSPIGNAPALRQKRFAVSREKNIGWLNQWLRKNLKCDVGDSVVSQKNTFPRSNDSHASSVCVHPALILSSS